MEQFPIHSECLYFINPGELHSIITESAGSYEDAVVFSPDDLRRQVGDVDFLSVVVFDVGENGLDVFHALVIVCLCRCEKPVLGERGQQEEQRCLDV